MAALASDARAQLSAQDKALADAFFEEGVKLLRAGKVAEACPKLAESQKKDPAIGTSLYLAECYERSGKIASAWAEFHQAEDMARARQDNRASLAKTRADRLSPSKLVITLTPGADLPGLEVRRDGELVAPAQYGLASPIDGGHHVIVATAPGHHRFNWSGDVPAQQGSVVVTIPKLVEAVTTSPTEPEPPPTVPTVTATVTSPPPPPPIAAERGRGLGGGKIAGLVIASVGLVGLGIGTAMGLVANGNYSATFTSAEDHCVKGGGCLSQAGVTAQNNAKTLADWSTGVFVGGGVALVSGLVLFFILPKSKSTTTGVNVTPLVVTQGGGAAVTGRFD